MPLKLRIAHPCLGAFLCTHHWYCYVIIINMIMLALCEFYTKASQMTRNTHQNGGDLSSSDHLSAVLPWQLEWSHLSHLPGSYQYWEFTVVEVALLPFIFWETLQFICAFCFISIDLCHLWFFPLLCCVKNGYSICQQKKVKEMVTLSLRAFCTVIRGMVGTGGWADGSMGKSPCCTSVGTWVQILSTYVKNGVWTVFSFNPSAVGDKPEGLLGLTGFQNSSKFSGKSCLKVIRRRIGRDMRHPPSSSEHAWESKTCIKTTIHTHINIHTHISGREREERRREGERENALQVLFLMALARWEWY